MPNAILNINETMIVSLPKNRKLNKGQTLLSLLISLAIFAILGHAIFTLSTSTYQLTSFSRARITARHLAQEKLELIRNLPYDKVGTIGGIPSGPLSQTENIVRNGLNYVVKISIIYIDDPFDGQAPSDLLPTDYKRVRIDVSWEGLASSRKNPVILVTDIAPKGVETTAGGGTLSILVFDANAVPISQTNVAIFSSKVNPPINLNLKTNDNGRVILPGTPACNECYKITVSKEGYSEERTYSPEEIANPNKPYLSVVEGAVTESSFAIDKLSTINIASVSDRDNNFSPLGNIVFRLRGQKTLGTDVNDLPVYKLDKQFTTDSGGNIIITEVEWDNYEIFLPEGSGYDISANNPLIPTSVLPDTTIDFIFALTSQTSHRLLAVFMNPSKSPVSSVSATLSFGTSVQTKISGAGGDPDFGQVFFSNLLEKNYDLSATASAYKDLKTKIKVSGYTKEEIILTPK